MEMEDLKVQMNALLGRVIAQGTVTEFLLFALLASKTPEEREILKGILSRVEPVTGSKAPLSDQGAMHFSDSLIFAQQAMRNILDRVDLMLREAQARQ